MSATWRYGLIKGQVQGQGGLKVENMAVIHCQSFDYMHNGGRDRQYDLQHNI